ncbi:hypothetical protein HZB94_01765 [Candidatus Falkowbacteria bacterium]|nr:hypothetical protein [Candidatus Falkowbacteria bacterium]
MRKLILLSAAILFLTACTAAPATLEKFEAKDAGFSILLPGKPTADSKTVDSAIGPLILNTFELNKGDTYYVISTTDYPASVFEGTTLDELLDSSRDGAVQNANGTLVKEEKITIDKYSGRQLEVSVAGNQTIKAKLALAEKRLYQIVIVGPALKMNSPEISQVLDSFLIK